MLLGGPLLDQYGDRVIYDPASRCDAHLSNFISKIGPWQWSCTTWELTEIVRFAERVEIRVGCEDRWVWTPERTS